MEKFQGILCPQIFERTPLYCRWYLTRDVKFAERKSLQIKAFLGERGPTRWPDYFIQLEWRWKIKGVFVFTEFLTTGFPNGLQKKGNRGVSVMSTKRILNQSD